MNSICISDGPVAYWIYMVQAQFRYCSLSSHGTWFLLPLLDTRVLVLGSIPIPNQEEPKAFVLEPKLTGT